MVTFIGGDLQGILYLFAKNRLIVYKNVNDDTLGILFACSQQVF